MVACPLIQAELLQAICNVLGETHDGLTGGQIGRLLSDCQIPDPAPSFSKRDRLFEALNSQQKQDGNSNIILDFLQKAMHPAGYTENQDIFNCRRDKLNKILSFLGYELGEDGKLRPLGKKVTTLSEARKRANQLRHHLDQRNVHSNVLVFCKAELLQENYFHAILEATKSVAQRIRDKTGIQKDGASLVDAAFDMRSKPYPRFAFNEFKTESDKSEHNGLVHLLKAAFLIFRNPTAHVPKISWAIDEKEALEALTLLSMLH